MVNKHKYCIFQDKSILTSIVTGCCWWWRNADDVIATEIKNDNIVACSRRRYIHIIQTTHVVVASFDYPFTSNASRWRIYIWHSRNYYLHTHVRELISGIGSKRGVTLTFSCLLYLSILLAVHTMHSVQKYHMRISNLPGVVTRDLSSFSG